MKRLSRFFALFVLLALFTSVKAQAYYFGGLGTSIEFGNTRIWLGSSYGRSFGFWSLRYRMIPRPYLRGYPAPTYAAYKRGVEISTRLMEAKRQAYFADAQHQAEKEPAPSLVPLQDPTPITRDPDLKQPEIQNDADKSPRATEASADGKIVVNYY